jgi:hypothetical protein
VKSAQKILDLIGPVYRDIGGNPIELVSIRPSQGGWLNALRFEVVRADGATTWLSRRDIDSANRRGLTKALKAFSHQPPAEDGVSPTQKAPEQRTWRRRWSEQNAAAERDDTREPQARATGHAWLQLLCSSCRVSRRHIVTIDDQSVANVVVLARCDTCGATIQLALTGGSKPGRTIVDRLKRAISLSTRGTPTASPTSKRSQPSMLANNTRRPKDTR